ncbi:hypothetical protein BGZ61DRAFT_438554 [Ilyonectria robusta]|uniref:uncharacterized protein n=1 Tax=Ilyonectria robusta TaxID=1079257 RepID=UPI001E8D313B|nr:uncharacterized protein BGZ61DRAFT_438554 [Ilyonectria robusta]KAH8737550.1 hypothetical protein BGZ61DRAFT_438554 [Ilyonectria robusta]
MSHCLSALACLFRQSVPSVCFVSIPTIPIPFRMMIASQIPPRPTLPRSTVHVPGPTFLARRAIETPFSVTQARTGPS